jgi:hypothetical protein
MGLLVRFSGGAVEAVPVCSWKLRVLGRCPGENGSQKVKGLGTKEWGGTESQRVNEYPREELHSKNQGTRSLIELVLGF